MSETADKNRGSRKTRKGIVVSAKQNKTIIVEVLRHKSHPLFKKVIKIRKKFAVHDEKGEAKEGDVVLIQETRPLSKTKRWRLLEVISHTKTLQTAGEQYDTDADNT
ncbi:MAG TPA: 30S ribosomal protein S17 [Victivallales bacterium]|nr:30S ribosomal protein S17 [Victivallales bacterium]HPO89716.1 30S ribosomal protein S17 [Victivallales bacterium]HRU00822.1 30S ribosomal protein S17 [Victivallales bacterium]